MLGYHNNQEATSTTIKDDWLFTGDVGNEIYCQPLGHYLINFNLWPTKPMAY